MWLGSITFAHSKAMSTILPSPRPIVRTLKGIDNGDTRCRRERAVWTEELHAHRSSADSVLRKSFACSST